MSINLTDEIEVKTKKGKLGAAKQIFLEGDQENLQQIGDKTHQLEDAIKDIAVSGGASTANAVSYNNETSGMTAVTAQGAIDELVTKNKSQDAIIAEKAEKSDVQSSVSELKAKNTSQDAEIAKKANTADVTSQMQAEQSRVNTELDKKFDKESILQESGEAEDKVMSQKATTTAIADEVARAKAAEQAILFDVSANNNGAVFESLSDLLSSSNLSTLIPTSVRHGGMSIRFIQSSNNKYVQYLYMGAAITGTHNPFLDEANWQGVDDVKSDISALQKKTLDFIEGSPTKFVEINNSDHFTIKPQTTAYYGGKNFFKFEDIPETTINGITYSVTNGVITLNGTATGGTELPLKAAPISIDSIGQLNMKVWRDGGSVSNNFSFLLFEKPNASGTLLLKAYVYSSFGDSGNISDVESTVETAPNNKGYLFLVAASGISFNNLIIRPMLTLADRYKAGDYSYGKTPIKITNETVVRSAKYCCVQAHTDFSIVSEMAKSDSLQKSIYGMNIKASSGKILKILDGVPFSNLVSADTESVRIKVVGKNLINYKGWFEAITGNPLIYQPIALRPNTTYIFTNKGTDLTHLSGTIQVRYGGITDTTSTILTTILGDVNVQELSFTTPDYDGQYYLRYYGNLCAEMREGTHGDFSTMMLVEGDTPLEYFEEYVEGDYLKNSARLSENDISYVYTENLDTVTIKYYSRIGSKGMPYYWQDYMDAKKMDLRKKLLSISMHGLAFSFFTDVHIDENTCNSAYLLDYLRDEVGIPFKVFGGDLLNYSNNEETESIIQYYRFRKLYMNDKDTFCTPGNHDFYSPMARNIFYNILVKPIELLFDTNGYNKIERTYFYIDNSSQKVRMIFLDSNDWDSEKPVMFNWYVEALNSIPNGWDCVIFSHILESGTYFGNDIPFFAKEYNDRTSGSHSLGDGSATITYDFASGTGKVICAIGGHSHKDYSNTDFGFPVILTTTDCVGGITVQHPTVPMTKGTITENAFDVFFINLDAKTIDAIRIGAGEDRHWTY